MEEKTKSPDSKNSSLEDDLLGVNSLLMSNSDSEEDEDVTIKVIAQSVTEGKMEKVESEAININIIETINKKPPNHSDKTSEEQVNHVPLDSTDKDMKLQDDIRTFQRKCSTMSNTVSDAEEGEVGIEPVKSSGILKKYSTIIDSDSGSGNDEKQSNNDIRTVQRKFSTMLNTVSDVEEGKMRIEPVKTSGVFKKYSAIIDSDSGSDSDEKQSNNTKITNKFELIDSNNGRNRNGEQRRKTKKLLKKKAKKIKSGLINSEYMTNSNSELNGNEENMIIEKEGLDDSEQMELYDDGEQSDGTLKKPKRASAKKALDEIQAIQSKQQRLHREAHVSVPYHRPKRYTLQEFLKRRMVIKPAAKSECSPAATILQKERLKMTPEELEEYAQLMEDRANEATNFFKSEIESEEEMLQTNSHAIDVEQNERVTEAEKEENVIENNELLEDEMEETKNDDTSAITITETMAMETLNVQAQQNKCSIDMDKETEGGDDTHISSQPLVTEVLELPSLDLNTLFVNQKDEIRHVSIAPGATTSSTRPIELFKQQLPILNNSPSIKGDNNMIIDLESGDMTIKKPTGADNLLQRLLLKHKARKSKASDTIHTNENGIVKMTMIKDEDINIEQKPGEVYVKLKENLKSLIKKKRVEEMKEKQIDENEYTKCLGEDDGDDHEDEDDDYDDDNDNDNDNIENDDNDDGDGDGGGDDDDDAEEYEMEEDIEAKQQTEELLADGVLDSTEKQRPEEIIDDEKNELDLCEEVQEEEEDMKEKHKFHADEYEHEENNAEDEAVENPDEGSSDSESDELKSKRLPIQTQLPNSQRISRIVKALSSDDDNDDDIDFLRTQILIEQSNVKIPMFGDIDSPLKISKIIPCTNASIGSTQELLNLCTGKFDTTQNQLPIKATADTAVLSQIPITQPTHLNAATEDELLGLCSGTFESSSVDQTQQMRKTRYTIFSSDEENQVSDENGDDTRKRVRKFRKKLRNPHVKLGFSDNETDEIDASELNGHSENVEVEEVDEEETEKSGTYVEYDSEENEITVEMTKKDRMKRAENFFEREAELSESDWSSADEDEKNLDCYDIELGDEDEFDRGKLQQQLGKIHAQKMLDEDIREIRKIQEILFENEETDGVGRERQFHWRNVENGFCLDDMKTYAGNGDGINSESGDEEQKQEHLWRKIRYEREQLLKNRGLKESSQEFTSHSPLPNLTANNSSSSKNTTPILSSNGKKLQIITKKSTSNLSPTKQKGSPFLISSNASVIKTISAATITTSVPPSSTLQHKTARRSFLTCDEISPTRFENIAKGKSSTGLDDDDQKAGTVLAKAKNFVFTTLTKEEHENLKRKANEQLNRDTEVGTNFNKKQRIFVEK